MLKYCDYLEHRHNGKGMPNVPFAAKQHLTPADVTRIYTEWASMRPPATASVDFLERPMESSDVLTGVGIVAAIYLNGVPGRVVLPAERDRARSEVMDTVENPSKSGFVMSQLKGKTNAAAIAYMINCTLDYREKKKK